MLGEVGMELRADESDFVVGVNDGLFGGGGRAKNASGEQRGERRGSGGSGELAAIHQKYDSAFRGVRTAEPRRTLRERGRQSYSLGPIPNAFILR